MQIGHSQISETFVPTIVKFDSDGTLIIDCPGFLDNRGSEINVANAVNIKNTLIRV